MLPLLAAFALAWLAADVATGRVTARLRARGILDLPNDRSSHATPTPRGGGLAIAGVLLAGIALGALIGWVRPAVALGIGGGGAAVAVVGWLDDRDGLRARTRALAHAGAAVWALAWLDGYPVVQLGLERYHLGTAGFVLGTVGIVWGINFFNFMDGIDGIAASQSLVVGLVGGLLLHAGGAPGLALVAVLTAGAAAGFLRWNWAPARVFMGDVGSTTLGFVLSTLGVAAANEGAVPMLAWGTLLGVFVFDATVTVLRRVVQGHPFWQPHREFGFHRAVRAGLSHAQVSGRVVLLTALLGALAALGSTMPRLMLAAAAAGLVLLGGLYLALESRVPMYTGPERRWALQAGSRYGRTVPRPPEPPSAAAAATADDLPLPVES